MLTRTWATTSSGGKRPKQSKGNLSSFRSESGAVTLSDRLLWRGSTTGAEFRVGYPWRYSQRARLHYQSHSKEGYRSVLLSELGRAKEFNASLAELNAFYMASGYPLLPLAALAR